jgi:hypothetical protein
MFSMRHAERRDDQAVALQNGSGPGARRVNDDDVQWGDATDTPECRSQHPECARLRIEQLLEEGAKGGSIRVPRRPRDAKGSLPHEVAPQQGRKIGHMIRMEMTDGDQREIVEAAAGLCKAEEGTTPRPRPH